MTPEQEWLSKYDMNTGKLKENLSFECMDWVRKNNERTDELISNYLTNKRSNKLFDLYNSICTAIKYYLDMPDDTISMLSIWIISTHFHSKFNTFPLLYFNAMKGSGKSRILKLISHLGLGCRGEITASISEASLYRADKRVICIDEFELSRQEKNELVLFLNSAYKKGSRVNRSESSEKGKSSFDQVSFDLYRPVVIANINGLDSVLEDRALIIILEHSFDDSITRKIEDYEYRLKDLINELKTLSSDGSDRSDMNDSMSAYINNWNDYVDSRKGHVKPLSLVSLPSSCHKFYENVYDANLSGRTLELCFPLLLVASIISEDVFNNLLSIFKKTAKIRRQSNLEDIHVQIYRFISTKLKDTFYNPTLLFNEFQSFCAVPTSMNVSSFSKALNRLLLISDTKRDSKQRTIKLDIDKAKLKIGLFDAEYET